MMFKILLGICGCIVEIDDRDGSPVEVRKEVYDGDDDIADEDVEDDTIAGGNADKVVGSSVDGEDVWVGGWFMIEVGNGVEVDNVGC